MAQYDVFSEYSTLATPPVGFEISGRNSVSRMHQGGPLNLFGFGGDDKKLNKVDAELARYSKLAASDEKYNELCTYIRQWSKRFESEPKEMRLTTPVKVFLSEGASKEENVVACSGVRIVFQKTNTGSTYLSSKEEKAMEKGNDNNDSEKPKKAKREGGIEVLVEQTDSGDVHVLARRCDMDEDTMIKEMSEERIIHELKDAIELWKKKINSQ